MKTKKMKSNKMKTRRKHKKWGGAHKQGTPRTSTHAHTLTPKQQAKRDRLRHINEVAERYVDYKVEQNRLEQEAMQAATAVAAQATRERAMPPEEQAALMREQDAAMREQDAAMQEQQSSNTHRSATRATPFVLPDLPDLGLIETRELGENYVNIAAIRSQWWKKPPPILPRQF